MKLPLYHSSAHHSRKPRSAHNGLWYNKFCNNWSNNWNDGLGERGKVEWLREVTGSVGASKRLQETALRAAILLRANGQTPLFFKTNSPFVTGLGLEHPIENGFAWHHTLGVPYLPGSSVKGMVRAFATHWGENAESEVSKKEVIRIFGPKTSDLDTKQEIKQEISSHIGSVIFFDALPVEPIRLKADIMTPHYQEYYASQGNNITPPADYLSPNPIPFLAVAQGATFQFGVLPRSTKNEADCQKVIKWLEEALTWIGAGAKTAVGYGRFEKDEETLIEYNNKCDRKLQSFLEAERRREEQAEWDQKMAGHSEVYKQLSNAELLANQNLFARNINSYLEALEANFDPEAVQLLDELVAHHFPEPYKDPEGKKAKKKPNQREWVLRLHKLQEKVFHT